MQTLLHRHLVECSKNKHPLCLLAGPHIIGVLWSEIVIFFVIVSQPHFRENQTPEHGVHRKTDWTLKSLRVKSMSLTYFKMKLNV